MTFKRFEEIPVWNRAADFAINIYRLTDDPEWPSRGSLKNQIERAALSVSNNIAEGFERGLDSRTDSVPLDRPRLAG